jgi:MFS-type transporter involved in bile tolerance (Atg22 family)
MNLELAATLTAVFALIGYFLMRFLVPTLNYERLVFLGSLALTSVFLMLMHRRQKRKTRDNEAAKNY